MHSIVWHQDNIEGCFVMFSINNSADAQNSLFCFQYILGVLSSLYRVFQKKRNPLSFKILQEIIRFESIGGIPSESTIYHLSNDIQVGLIS